MRLNIGTGSVKHEKSPVQSFLDPELSAIEVLSEEIPI
jgi:hypothetical protein